MAHQIQPLRPSDGRELHPEDARGGRLSRRSFLLRSGTVVASGILASRIGGFEPALAHGEEHGSAEPALPVWAATRSPDGRYLALAGDAAHPDVAELALGGDGTVTLGSMLGVAFPGEFAPVAVLAAPGRLLVAGAAIRERERVVVTYGQDHLRPGDRGGVPTDDGFLEGTVTVPVHDVRPSLGEVSAGGFRELPLEEQAPGAFGVATGVTSLPGSRLATVVEGSGDREQAYNDVTRLAESVDGEGLAWRFQVIASGLGEGRRAHLAVTTNRLHAVTADQTGRQAYHERELEPTARWSQVQGQPGAGGLLALVPRGGDTVEVVALQGSDVVRLRHRPDQPGWQHAGTVTIPGDRVVGAIGVTGTRGELLALGQRTATLVS